jgi:serine/threonine protein kinase
MNGGLWTEVSTAAKDLITRMLTVDPLQRITAQQVELFSCFSPSLHLTSPHLTSPHLTSPHLTLSLFPYVCLLCLPVCDVKSVFFIF